MGKTEYTPRGIRNEKLLAAFTNGRYKTLLETIKADDELDIQIRADYVNVYYKGGNIARIESPYGCVGFDEYYFLREDMIPVIPQIKGRHKINVSGDKDRGIPPQTDIINKLRDRRNKLKIIFKEENYSEYFRQAKEAMDGWFMWNPRREKEEQQQIVHRNTQDDAEFYVLDVEYQISILSPFKCGQTTESGKQKSPRPDIIAVGRDGQLYVIELKKGCGACGGKAGLKAHKEAYKGSIGCNTDEFVKEFKNVLKQKQDFQLADKSLFIDDCKQPIYIFAYALDPQKPKDTMAKFKEICKDQDVDDVGILECRSDHKLVRYK